MIVEANLDIFLIVYAFRRCVWINHSNEIPDFGLTSFWRYKTYVYRDALPDSRSSEF